MSKLHLLPATSETVRTGVVSRDDQPVLSIRSGDLVSIETWSAWSNKVTRALTIDDVMKYFGESDGAGPHDLTGPIFVEDAQPGDVLRVDVLDIVLKDHGYNIQVAGPIGLGLLPEDYPDGHVWHYDLPPEGRDGIVHLSDGFEIPMRPFLGYMGVAPRDDGGHSSIPPGPHGGNIDIPDLTAGSTLFLPVWAEGALFTAGDAHAAQGYGEINLTCIEASAQSALLRLTVLRGGEPLQLPVAETSTEYITLSFAESLAEATQVASRLMISEVRRRLPDVNTAEAYAICAIAMNLKISQVVNLPMVGVQASIDKSHFRAGSPWFSRVAGWESL